MDNIIHILNNFVPYIILVLLFIIIILIITVFVLIKSVNRVERKYKKFMRGVNNKNLEELVIGYLDKIDEVENQSKLLKEDINKINDKLKKCIQKTGIVRYRAFDDVGSDLSFSIALLDDKNDGIILTGIFGRNESTTYAKPIDKGISRYDLSEEEQQVLEEAMSK